MPFDQSTRNRLARFVADARGLLTQEFTRQLQNDYGLDPERGAVTDLARLGHLDDQRRETARILRATLEHYLAGAAKPTAKARQEALERIVREQAFTVLNRLAALRMAEARGLLIESVGQGYRSKGFQLYARLAGPALGETGDAYRSYLFSLFDEFSVDLAVLFDRFSPQGRLFPREAALLQLLELINHPEIDPLWAEDETIGWVYQYFNSQEERRQMRAESQAPRNSRELAVRNQFFTPRYVVEFLTDNTLGRIWYEMTKGQTSLVESCRYLVRRPNEIFLDEGEEVSSDQLSVGSGEDLSQEELLRQPVFIPHRPLKDPRELRMLDPACGSMHFGLYAFDLFERIYAEAWELAASGQLSVISDQSSVDAPLITDNWSLLTDYPTLESLRRAIPRLIIEHNIHGIDVDPRAVQIAGLSLWLRAQRSWQEQGMRAGERPVIARSHIVCAEPMPGDRGLLEEFLADLREERLESLIRHVIAVPENQRVRATPSMADALAQLIRTVWAEMELAGEAGSLLKIEGSLAGAIERGRAEWDQKLPLFRVETFRMSGEGQAAVERVRYPRTLPDGDDFWERAEGLVLAALEAYAQRAENGRSYARRLFAGDAAQGFAFIDLCRQRYDVVLMNPPFGEVPIPARSHLYQSNPVSAQDIFAAFVERFSASLVNAGLLGAITSRLGFYKDWLTNWRVQFYGEPYSIQVFADLGYGVLDAALVEAAAYVIGPTFAISRAIFFNELDQKDKSSSLKRHVLALSQAAIESLVAVHDIDVSLFIGLPNSIAPHWCSVSWLRFFSERMPLKPDVCQAKLGLATGNDFRFLRLAWEVEQTRLTPFNEWTWFAKGGEYEPFYGHIHLVLNWRYAALSRRTTSPEFYGKSGATYTERTTSNLSVRVLPSGCIMSYNGPGIYTNSSVPPLALVGLLNSAPYQFMIEMLIGGGDTSQAGTAARHFMPSIIESLPKPVLSSDDYGVLESCARRLFHLSVEHRSNEVREFFESPFASGMDVSIRMLAEKQFREQEQRVIDAVNIAESIDSIVSAGLNLSNLEVTEARTVVGRPFPSEAVGFGRQGVISNRLAGISPSESDEEAITSRAVAKRSSVIDDFLETICHEEVASLSSIVSLRRATIAVPQWYVFSICRDIISFVLGCSYGRWNVTRTRNDTSRRPDFEPMSPLPVCSPGMLQNAAGLPAAPSDVPADYPLRISWPGILVDDPGHPEDIEGRVREALAVIWPENADAIEQEACQILGVDGLRAWFAVPNHFFDDHLKRYSKSRRAAPIYWPLSSASGSYTLWLYYHRLTDQTLYLCVNDFVEPKLKVVGEQLAALRGKGSRSGQEEREWERLDSLERELVEFREELLRVARFWRPNLNDGVQISAAPLWRLFRHRGWSKRLQETWEKLEAGEYDWAHLALSVWPARVVPKCVEDRSLAIAHDVEELFWVEDGGNWRNLRSPEEELAEQRRRLALTEARGRAVALLGDLARRRGQAYSGAQVYAHLAAGDWDDLPLARLLWPQRAAQKCWNDPLLAMDWRVTLSDKKTQKAQRDFSAQMVAAGCPEVADPLADLLAAEDAPFTAVWARLPAGAMDATPLALSLWPERVLEKCLADADLAGVHGLRGFFWVQGAGGVWRLRVGDEVKGEVGRRA